MSDTGYLIRRLGKKTYGISSWTFDKEPRGVYAVEQKSKNKFWCDCPSRGVKQCKHIPLIQKFIANENNWDPYRMITND